MVKFELWENYQQQQQQGSNNAESIEIRDVTLAWNGRYRDEVRAKELTPIIERMTTARDEYLNATLDYYEFIDEYSALHRNIAGKAAIDWQPDGYLTARELASSAELPGLDNSDFIYIEDSRKLPNGIKRTKIGGK